MQDYKELQKEKLKKKIEEIIGNLNVILTNPVKLLFFHNIEKGK